MTSHIDLENSRQAGEKTTQDGNFAEHASGIVGNVCAGRRGSRARCSVHNARAGRHGSKVLVMNVEGVSLRLGYSDGGRCYNGTGYEARGLGNRSLHGG